MNFALIIAFLFITLEVSASESQLTSFETDYCTNYKEGTRKFPDLWKHCCLIHDMYFWAGGSKQDRFDSDLELRSCIEETGAYGQARVMYYAVRAGSYSPIKFPKKKWNHGWKDRATFQKLTTADIDMLEQEINSAYEYISPSIKLHFINQLRSRLE
jgi:hypothetical protein